jgi:transmembrane sensor
LDETIIRFLQGRATSEEATRLAAWRRATAGNERHFQEVAGLWRATAPSGASTPLPDTSVVVERARRGRTTARVAAFAAVLLLGFAIGELRPGGEPAPGLGVGEFVTGPTEMATARLSDGTVVRLAPDSRMRMLESATRREVWLDGKAFFAVAASERHPFVIRTRAGDAHVLGTRFEVQVRDEDLRVAVVEGRVDVGDDDTRIRLDPGQVARARRGVEPVVSNHPNVSGLIGWVGAFIAFESTSLLRVAEELEQRYDIQVHIADPSLNDRTVTAWFGEEDVDSVLAVVCRIADVYCNVRDDVVTIEP